MRSSVKFNKKLCGGECTMLRFLDLTKSGDVKRGKFSEEFCCIGFLHCIRVLYKGLEYHSVWRREGGCAKGMWCW